MSADRDKFDLFQPNIVERLRELDWFKKVVSLHYHDTAQAFGCVAVMSEERLIQAFDVFWHDADGAKLRNLPKGAESLDQFKICSYLTFWLRRINPVREIRPMLSLAGHEEWVRDNERLTKKAEDFILYGNEVCAILLSIKLCQYLTLVGPGETKKGKVALLSIKSFDQDTTVEFGKILKHKNISANGVNMALQMLCGVGQTTHLIRSH
jgi:hypothetical protein